MANVLRSPRGPIFGNDQHIADGPPELTHLTVMVTQRPPYLDKIQRVRATGGPAGRQPTEVPPGCAFLGHWPREPLTLLP